MSHMNVTSFLGIPCLSETWASYTFGTISHMNVTSFLGIPCLSQTWASYTFGTMSHMNVNSFLGIPCLRNIARMVTSIPLIRCRCYKPERIILRHGHKHTTVSRGENLKGIPEV